MLKDYIAEIDNTILSTSKINIDRNTCFRYRLLK